MANKTLYMTLGLQGSGKSTWSKDIVKKDPRTKRVNRDTLRDMVDAGEWSRDREKAIITARNAVVEAFLSSSFNVIVDDTNFAKDNEPTLRGLAEKHGAEFKIKDFTDVPLAVCIERDALRSKSVGESVIIDTYNKYVYQPVEYVSYNPKLPSAICVDLDGTMFNMGDRGPFDWMKVHLDTPRHIVWDAVQGIWNMRKNPKDKIIFLSGRDAICRDLSSASLLQHFGIDTDSEWTEFYMRPMNDQRKDTVVKEEIYRKYIEGRFNITAIFDDRGQVVRHWIKLGFGDRLFNVGNGREF